MGERSSTFWLLMAVLLAVAIRLPGLNRPLVGHYATKNVTYAMIARNWVEGRASLWRPTMDCMTGGQRGWHLLELPVAAYATGAAWRVCGGSLDVWGRAVSVACSAAAVGLMFLLVRRWHGLAAAGGAAVALAIAPASIVFGQSFMLEASVVALSLATFLLLDNWLLSRRLLWLALATVAFALLLLTKIYMLVLAAPFLSLAWRRSAAGDRTRNLLLACAAGVLAVAPAATWYAGVLGLSNPSNPDSAHVFYSVRQSATAGHWPHPLLTQADFYRQALDDLTGFTLTPLGFALLLLSALNPGWRRHAVWLASMLLLVAVLPSKFHVLKYYHLVILPPLCVLVGLGWQTLSDRLRPTRRVTAAVLAMGMLLSLRYAARPAFVTPEADAAVVPAAAALQSLAHVEEPVITMHGTTTDLLYYCNRPGWAMAADDAKLASKLTGAVRQGAGWLVVADLKAAQKSKLAQAELAHWPVVAEGTDWRIYRLTRSPIVAQLEVR